MFVSEPEPRRPIRGLLKLTFAVLIAGLLLAGLGLPAALVLSGGVNTTVKALEDARESLKDDKGLPTASTLTDKTGSPIASFYTQNRTELKPTEISTYAKLALVSIEDKRFFSHNGIDFRGTLRAVVGNAKSGSVQGGASTIEQQYIKNYRLLVEAKTDVERQAAVEQSPARKLTEVQLALDLNKKFTKEEILTKYLNLVPFGQSAYGIESAAQTYFGIPAKNLNIQQAAMLIGMLQASEYFNPYVRPQEVKEKRDIVLDYMADTKSITKKQSESAKKEPLGVLKEPRLRQQGCVSATVNGFFCDYALDYLARAGISKEDVQKNGYVIKTTMDPELQRSAKQAANSQVNPRQPGVAAVMNVVLPGQKTHDVAAMVSSRDYGLNTKLQETTLPLTHSLVGHGTGSTFKIFTAAAALEKGAGINTKIPSPSRIEVSGMGTGGASGCPANKYCVENSGSYPSEMTLQDALAQSPNTAFISLIQFAGVKDTVDMAVRLGLRSYSSAKLGIDGVAIADGVKDKNTGAFTLGYTPVNALEMSNVGATLASGGVWCPPNPIAEVKDRFGNPVAINRVPCEQVVPKGLADTLLVGMSKDTTKGTAAAAASAAGWSFPMSGKTGTTEGHGSAAFMGITSKMSALSYVLSDSPRPQTICTSPARMCGDYGNIYGGNEPANIWMRAISPMATAYGPIGLPPASSRFVSGTKLPPVPDVVGLSPSAAESKIRSAGYSVKVVGSTAPGSRVVRQSQTAAFPGTVITITSEEPKKKPAPKPSTGSDSGASDSDNEDSSDGTSTTEPTPSESPNDDDDTPGGN